MKWGPSTDDRVPQSLIRYDVYVNGELRGVVVGNTSVTVEGAFGSNNISVSALDTAANESTPARPRWNSRGLPANSVRPVSEVE